MPARGVAGGERAWLERAGPWKGRGAELGSGSHGTKQRGGEGAGWSQRGAEASVHWPRTHQTKTCHLARPAYARSRGRSCLRETYLSRVSPLSRVHTASTEGRTAPSSSRSHRPQPAQARCTQVVSGEGPPRECAFRTRPPSEKWSQSTTRPAQARCAQARREKAVPRGPAPYAGARPTQAHFMWRASRRGAKRGLRPW